MKLEPGEVICDKCSGTGKFIDPTQENSWKHPWCPKCHGAKKVDWVTNVMWKKCVHYIKPGVYIQEVDLSEYIPSISRLKILPLGTNNKKVKV